MNFTSSEIADVETALVVAHFPINSRKRRMSNDKGSFNVGDLTTDRSITLNFSERLQRQKANTINSWTLVFCIVIFLRLIHGLLHDHMLLMQKRLYLNESVYNNRESVDSSSYSNRKQ
ncbi:hypothetical protein YC2023_035333 [Brassica napus]